MLLAGIAGVISYNFAPVTGGSPVADFLSPGGVFSAPALSGLLGQGQVSPDTSLPAPIITATADGGRHRPGSTHPARPAAGTDSGNAAGLGFYDGQFSPSGIETAASWLGSSRLGQVRHGLHRRDGLVAHQ